MCGVCGVVSQTPISDLELVGRMQDSMRHRGPDCAGEFRETHVSMAMRRLSIIDLTGGSQPLYNEDHSLVLIANAAVRLGMARR